MRPCTSASRATPHGSWWCRRSAARLSTPSSSRSIPRSCATASTSPGGTSADALYQLEKGGFRTVMSDAVLAAYERSVALGEMSTKAASEKAASVG